jgi:YVTN family beta-propeller protein
MIRVLPLVWFLVISPLAAQERMLLVSHKAESSLDFYTLQGKHLAHVTVGKHPHEMVLSPDGRYAYTTDNGTMAIEVVGEGGNTISIVDVRARKNVGKIDLGRYHRPHGIDIDRQGKRLYVTTENPDQLLAIDPATRRVLRTYDTHGKTSHMVKLGRDGKWAYVSNSRSASVSAINLETGEAKVIAVGERPEGSVLSNDGKELYVANREGGSISVIGTEQRRRVADIKTGESPVRVGITPDDRTLVYALLEGRKIGFADARGRKVIAEITVPHRLVSLNLSPDGKLAFASAQWDDMVYVVSVPEQKVLRVLKTLPGGGPDPVLEITSAN